jgi:hypothetical protein
MAYHSASAGAEAIVEIARNTTTPTAATVVNDRDRGRSIDDPSASDQTLVGTTAEELGCEGCG